MQDSATTIGETATYAVSSLHPSVNEAFMTVATMQSSPSTLEEYGSHFKGDALVSFHHAWIFKDANEAQIREIEAYLDI